jgi:uncharacterized repeat protein (TIGR03843 family)
LHVLGRHPQASNVALICTVAVAGQEVRCIYKPTSGERPLWDFPGAALAGREVLAVLVAKLLGWDLVPETAWRKSGPAGPGMCQEWIVEQAQPPVGIFPQRAVPAGWLAVATGHDATGEEVVVAHEDSADVMRLAVLDAVLNNGDRKGGHVLRRVDGRLAAIDHGVTFHLEPKLRTVLWGWAGDPVPPSVLADLSRAAASLPEVLSFAPARLSDQEAAACSNRLQDLLARGTFPLPGTQWPALPWPPM